jgi:hypothetical protein
MQSEPLDFEIGPDMRLVDVKVVCTGIDVTGKEVSGTVTARINIAKQPWPDQDWDGWTEGQYPLLMGTPVTVKEIISAEVVEIS